MELNEKKEILKNSGWNIFTAFIQRLGGLILTILLARFLLPDSFGIYNIAMSIAAIFISFHVGLNDTFLRFLSESLGNKNKRKTQNYFQYISKLKLLLSGIASLVLILLAYPLSFYIFKKETLFLPLIFSSFYIFSFSMEAFFTQLFFATKKVKGAAFKEIISQSLKIAFVFITFLSIASAYHISGVIISTFLASLIVSAGILLYCHEHYSYLFKNKSKIIREDIKRILKFFGYLAIWYAAFAFFSYIDIFMIGILISDSSFVGYYRSAFILVSSIGGVLVFANILIPVLTQSKKYSLESAFNKACRYVMIITIPSAFGLAVLGRYFIRAIYGYNYLPASQPLYVLSFLLIVNVICSLFLVLFSSREKPHLHLPLLAAVIVVGIVSNYFLISLFLKISSIAATIGAAIATLLSMTVYDIGLYKVASTKLNVKADFSCVIKPTIASFVMLFSLIIYIALIKNMTLFTGILGVILGVLIYTFVMFLIKGVDKNDYLLIKSTFKK